MDKLIDPSGYDRPTDQPTNPLNNSRSRVEECEMMGGSEEAGRKKIESAKGMSLVIRTRAKKSRRGGAARRVYSFKIIHWHEVQTNEYSQSQGSRAMVVGKADPTDYVEEVVSSEAREAKGYMLRA